MKKVINKNEWYTIYKQGMPVNCGIIWFDNNDNALHGLPRAFIGSKTFKYTLDLRTSKQKWIKHQIQFDKILNNKEQHFTFF